MGPFVGFGFSKVEHFQRAATIGATRTDPWGQPAAADPDLVFAAEKLVENRERLREPHQYIAGLLKELARRFHKLDERLRSFQTAEIRRVAGGVAIAFVVALSILMGWRDYALAMRFILGFQATGKHEDSHNWTPVDIDEPICWDQIYAEKPCLMRELDARPPEEEAQFLWDSLIEEHTKGVADLPVTEEEMDARHQRWAPTGCFCHKQASGKRRRIDNAKRSGKNRMTQRSEKFTMTNALLPALMLRVLFAVAFAMGASAEISRMAFETGGEDMPDAFRGIPTRVDNLQHFFVAAKDPIMGVLMFF